MASNTGKNTRKGAVKNRTQVYNPKTDSFVKRDATSGRFVAVKKDGTPFKGISKEGTKQLAPVFRKLRDYDKKK